MIDFVKKGKSTKDATAVASDILQGKTAYVNDKKITGTIITEALPASLTLVEEEKNIAAANNNILDYFVLNGEEFVISSSATSNMSSIVVQNSLTQNTINISDIKSGCVLLSAKLFNFNVAGEIGMLVVIQESSSKKVYFGVVALNVNSLQTSNIYVNETIETVSMDIYCNIIYNKIKNAFAIVLKTYNGAEELYTYIVQCNKNEIVKLYENSTYLCKDWDGVDALIDAYWSSNGLNLFVHVSIRMKGDTRESSYLFKYSDNLMSATVIKVLVQSYERDFFGILNNEYLINNNNQIYKINNNNVSLYKTVSNINISNKKACDKIITLNNCFYLYFSVNNGKIYIYKYDENFNFTYEREIDWAINSTNATYSNLLYCPSIVDNVIRYNELNKIREIYTITNNPNFASLERNNIKYCNTSDANALPNEIISGKVAYGTNGKITGTMQNNGQLNYGTSISQQIIPAGYTSGGTIAASPLTQEEYNSCLVTTQEILGLPNAGYILSELLHINSSKIIDLGIKVNLNNTYKLKFKDTSISSYECYIGTAATNTYICRDGGSNKLGGLNTNNTIKTVPTNPTEITFKFLSAANKNIWLGSTGGSNADNADYDFYYLKVYDNANNLINQFIPVIHINNNKIGIYDTVNNKLIEY